MIRPERRSLVLDKSFANSCPTRVRELSQDWQIIVPSAFYFEVFTTLAKNRVRELGGLDIFHRIELHDLFQAEIKNGKPATTAESPPLSINSIVLNREWEAPDYVAASCEKYAQKRISPLISFWETVISLQAVVGYTASDIEELRRSKAGFINQCQKLQNTSFVRELAGMMELEHADKLDARWALFRWVQARVLHGLVLLFRHPPNTSPPKPERMEHDVNDMEYLILAAHCGALATKESKPEPRQASLKWRFELLRPDGVLISE